MQLLNRVWVHLVFFSAPGTIKLNKHDYEEKTSTQTFANISGGGKRKTWYFSSQLILQEVFKIITIIMGITKLKLALYIFHVFSVFDKAASRGKAIKAVNAN